MGVEDASMMCFHDGLARVAKERPAQGGSPRAGRLQKAIRANLEDLKYGG